MKRQTNPHAGHPAHVPTPGGVVHESAGCLPGRLSDRPASPDPMACTCAALPNGRALPLYIRVAQWVMALGRPVSRDDIAREFSTTARRAGDMMLYIGSTGARIIESERFLSKEGAGREVALIRVTMVWPELYTPSRSGRPRGSFRVTRPPEPTSLPELRDLFLGRRVVRGAS